MQQIIFEACARLNEEQHGCECCNRELFKWKRWDPYVFMFVSTIFIQLQFKWWEKADDRDYVYQIKYLIAQLYLKAACHTSYGSRSSVVITRLFIREEKCLEIEWILPERSSSHERHLLPWGWSISFWMTWHAGACKLEPLLTHQTMFVFLLQ